MTIGSIIRKRLQKAQELTETVFQRVELNKNIYRGQMEVDDQYDWDYTLVDQHVFPLIRNYLSRTNPAHMEVALFHRKPEDMEKRQVNQDFINWELNEIRKTVLMIRMGFSAYVAGRGYLKTGWRYEPKVVIQTDQGKQIIMRDLLNRADAKFVRFNDILIPNRNIPTLQDQPYILELVNKRVGEMYDENEAFEKDGGKPYWDKNWLAKLKKSGVKTKKLDFTLDTVTDTDVIDDIAFKSAYVSLICMQTLEGDLIYIPYNGSEDDKPVNLDQSNPYWHGHYPYVDFAVFPEDDDFYSMSVVDAVADSQIAATEILNQTLTNIRQINNNSWIAGSAAANTPDWQFKSMPNGIIRVAGDVNQIQQVRPIDNTMSALRMLQELQGRIEKTGGISSLYSSGVPGAKINQTARGAQIIDANIETNMQLILDIIGESVVKPLAEHFLELNAQYVTEEQTFSVTGKKGVKDLVTISPEVVTANFDVYANTDRFQKQTPASRQASIQNLITMISSQAQATGVQVDYVPLYEALLDSYSEMASVGEVIMTIDEKSQRDIASLVRGQMPEVLVRDPHQELISLATIFIEENPDIVTPEIEKMFAQYVQKHMRFLQMDQEIRMMSQPVMPQAQTPEQLAGQITPQDTGTDQQGEVPETMGMSPEDAMTSYNLGNIA